MGLELGIAHPIVLVKPACQNTVCLAVSLLGTLIRVAQYRASAPCACWSGCTEIKEAALFYIRVLLSGSGVE